MPTNSKKFFVGSSGWNCRRARAANGEAICGGRFETCFLEMISAELAADSLPLVRAIVQDEWRFQTTWPPRLQSHWQAGDEPESVFMPQMAEKAGS